MAVLKGPPFGHVERERWDREEACFDVETFYFSGRGDSYLFTFDGARANHLFDGLGS